jgi:hypothetical protein
MDQRMLMRIGLAVVAIAATTLAVMPNPPQLGAENISDKIRHMAAFATLSLLAARGFPRTSLWRIGERLSFLGAMIEVVQSIPALHRDCDIRDWIADTVAIAAALLFVAWIRERRKRRDAT